MKKFIPVFILLILLLSACGTYRTITVSRLKLGMSKADVEHMFGPPKRILSVSQTEYGYQEVLEYKTSNDEIYALDFMNDQLVGYEFLYDDIDYIPPMPQPVVIVHDYPGRPIARPPKPRPPVRPVPPVQPVPPARPSPDNVTPSRPQSNRPTPSRPETGSTPTRQPVSGTNTGAERPSQPQRESSRQPRTETTGSSSDNQRTSTSPAENSSGSGRR